MEILKDYGKFNSEKVLERCGKFWKLFQNLPEWNYDDGGTVNIFGYKYTE